jgi:hypothetical protein
MSYSKKRKYRLCVNGWVVGLVLVACCWLVVGDSVRYNSTVLPRANSSVKIGIISKSREAIGTKFGGSDSKRHREGIKLGEGSRNRDQSTIRVTTTLPPKGESSSDDKSKFPSVPNNSSEGNASVAVGRPAVSTTESPVLATTKLHIGLVVPSKSFGVREYTKAFHASITGLQTRTRGKKLKMFNKHDISPRYDMKSMTPSPTGRNCLFQCLKRHTLSVKQRFYCVTSYLTEKLSKLPSFDRQYRWPQNCFFQSSFTQITAQFTQGIPQFPQFTCPHNDGIISRHSNLQHPCLAIHSADEHRMMYSFSNTTSYSTFYAFFSSFRITL